MATNIDIGTTTWSQVMWKKEEREKDTRETLKCSVMAVHVDFLNSKWQQHLLS